MSIDILVCHYQTKGFDFVTHKAVLTFVLVYKGKVFYGQEPPSGESTTTECGVKYQLLAVMLLK